MLSQAVQDTVSGLPRRNWVPGVALAWSLFQLWVASDLSAWLPLWRPGEAEVRSIHLAFALLLVFLIFPCRGRGLGHGARLSDGVLAVVAALAAGYLAIFYDRISAHPGAPQWHDVASAVVGICLLLEATRRTLGPGMVVLAVVLLGYLFLGAHAPEMIAHKGASLAKVTGHLWLSTEGVFGIALAVSASFIFLFVLFGALLDVAGGSAYLVRGTMALFGHLRGGPAKAAVFVSAANGLVSGAPITNVVTTGPVTIPMVKRVGYPAEKAAAIEVSSSVNGQMMPPVMGAAAFLMVDATGVAYVDVLKHALISAMVAYFGLIYIVHLEAVKAGLHGLPRRAGPWRNDLIGFARVLVIVALLGIAVGAAAEFSKTMLPRWSGLLIAATLFALYVYLLHLAGDDLILPDGEEVAIRSQPRLMPALRSGPHFLLPVGVLLWNLVIAHMSPTRAAFWAVLMLIVIVLTQRALVACLRGDYGRCWNELRRGVSDLRNGLINGGLNMIPVAVGTAAAGIVIGSFTLTGVGLILADIVEVLSGGNVLLMLIMVACICLILGTGLTTTTNYLIVSSLLVPVIMTVGGNNGLFVPLIAAHLFVFYFGLMADILPPAGLATHAAASIAGANAVRTGVIAFRYSLRMVILPFMFVFNSHLLLIDVNGFAHGLLVVMAATLAGFVFISVNQAWLLVRSSGSERVLLLLATVMLFHPGLFMDRWQPPFVTVGGAAIGDAIMAAPDGGRVRIIMSGTTLEGRVIERAVLLPLAGRADSAEARLEGLGMKVVALQESGGYRVESVGLAPSLARLGIEPGFVLEAVQLRADRIAKEWMFLPALLLIAWVWQRQRRRRGGVAKAG